MKLCHIQAIRRGRWKAHGRVDLKILHHLMLTIGTATMKKGHIRGLRKGMVSMRLDKINRELFNEAIRTILAISGSDVKGSLQFGPDCLLFYTKIEMIMALFTWLMADKMTVEIGSVFLQYYTRGTTTTIVSVEYYPAGKIIDIGVSCEHQFIARVRASIDPNIFTQVWI